MTSKPPEWGCGILAAGLTTALIILSAFGAHALAAGVAIAL